MAMRLLVGVFHDCYEMFSDPRVADPSHEFDLAAVFDPND